MPLCCLRPCRCLIISTPLKPKPKHPADHLAAVSAIDVAWRCLDLKVTTPEHSEVWCLDLVGGWTNPFEKYESKWVHLPQIGVKIKNIWGRHLVVSSPKQKSGEHWIHPDAWRFEMNPKFSGDESEVLGRFISKHPSNKIWSVHPGWLGYIGDDKLSSYIYWGIIIGHYV